MFDTLKVNYPLPLNKKEQAIFSNIDWSKQAFQTKDLECTLSTYTLNKNGNLCWTKVDGIWTRTMSKEEEKKARKKNPFVWPHKFVEKSRKTVKHNYTGNIDFYESVEDNEGNEWWVEFTASLSKGKITGKIKKKEVRLSRSKKEIEKQELEWQNRLAKEEKLFHNRFRKFMNKITLGYWRNFWFLVGKPFRKIANKIQNVDIWINRYIA